MLQLHANLPAEIGWQNVLAGLAGGLGLNRDRFLADFASEKTEAALQEQFLLRDRLQVRSFPSLVFEQYSRYKFIQHDYQDFTKTLNEINRQLR